MSETLLKKSAHAEYLPTAVAARLLRVSPTRMKAVAAINAIAGFAVPGGRTYYLRADVERVLNESRLPVNTAS